MSSFWKKTLIWLGLEDEGVEEGTPSNGALAGYNESRDAGYPEGSRAERYRYPEQYRDREQPSAADVSGVTVYPDPSSGSYIASTHTPAGAEAAGFEAGSGVRMLPPTEARVHIVEPEGFADAQEIGEKFRQAQPVIVDLADVERDTARRIVDFASGLTFALRGRMRKIGDHVFLLVPAHASISEDEKARLRASGYEV